MQREAKLILTLLPKCTNHLALPRKGGGKAKPGRQNAPSPGAQEFRILSYLLLCWGAGFSPPTDLLDPSLVAMPGTRQQVRPQGLVESVRLSQGQPGLCCHKPQVTGLSHVRGTGDRGAQTGGNPLKDHRPDKGVSNPGERSLAPLRISQLSSYAHPLFPPFPDPRKVPPFPVPVHEDLNRTG